MTTYVNPDTGEIHEDYADGLVEVDLDEPPEASQDGPLDWLPDYYTRQVVRIEAERAAAKAAHAAIMRELDAREKALAHRWQAGLEVVIRSRLTGESKSVKTAYGRCGWRRSKRVEVRDEAAALEWAREHAPDAVRVTESLRRSELPESEEVPGVFRVEDEKFYVRGAK